MNLITSLQSALWRQDNTARSSLYRAGIRALRISYVIVRDLIEGQLTLRAMSLVYTTLLSLVPLLAVSFSVLKAFNIHDQLEPMLLNVLQPLGPQGVEITARITGFVENARADVLGSIGVALLLYTVVSLIQKIEQSFNYTWHVKQLRPMAQRFRDYLVVIFVGPVLVVAALALMGSFMNHTLVQHVVDSLSLGSAIIMFGKLLPYLLIIAAFCFVYLFVPNAKVKVGAALVGATVAGVLWKTTGWAFATFVLASSKYTMIYSAFATLIMFMIWLYLGWLILLTGASIAFYFQHPEYLSEKRRDLVLSSRLRERLALQVMALVARHFYTHQPNWTLAALARRMDLPMEAVEPVLMRLQEQGLLVETNDDPPAYLPGRPPEATPIIAVLAAVRSAGEGALISLQQLNTDDAVSQLAEQLESAFNQQLQDRTLKDLAGVSDLPATGNGTGTKYAARS